MSNFLSSKSFLKNIKKGKIFTFCYCQVGCDEHYSVSREYKIPTVNLKNKILKFNNFLTFNNVCGKNAEQKFNKKNFKKQTF